MGQQQQGQSPFDPKIGFQAVHYIHHTQGMRGMHKIRVVSKNTKLR